jgi:hypothetical protein
MARNPSAASQNVPSWVMSTISPTTNPAIDHFVLRPAWRLSVAVLTPRANSGSFS